MHRHDMTWGLASKNGDFFCGECGDFLLLSSHRYGFTQGAGKRSVNQRGKRRKAFKYIKISRVADYHGSAVK